MKSFIAEGMIAYAQAANAVVLDGLRAAPHPSHMSIDEAVAVGRAIAGAATWITHLTHMNDHAELAATLTAAGIPVQADEVVTAVVATAAYLRMHHPGSRVFLLSDGAGFITGETLNIGGGMGLGLPGSKRLGHAFDVQSVPG